jgi:CRP-like cAMP-binding protein
MPRVVAESRVERSTNRLLASLPEADYMRLRPALRTVRTRAGEILAGLRVPNPEVFFPGGGVCVIGAVTGDGRTAAVAAVGREGMVALPPFGGNWRAGMTATVLIGGADAHALGTEAFRREVQRGGPFAEMVGAYTDAFGTMLMQSVVCNALHSVEQRCARWLLEIRDRVGDIELPLTHNVLGDLLGVRRETVTLSAGLLERERLIERHRRRIRIIDDGGLERASCECYAIIKGHFARLFP